MTKPIIPVFSHPRWTMLVLVLLGLLCNGCITIACLALTGGRGTGCSAAAHADGQIAGAFVGAVVQGAAAAAVQEDEDEGEDAPGAMPLPPSAALRTNEEPRLPPPPFYTPPPSVAGLRLPAASPGRAPPALPLSLSR